MSEIYKIDKADSSNNLAMELINKKKPPEFSIIWVINQTKGKGQGNNSWHSMPNMNITISMIVYPIFLKPENFFYLSKLTALVTQKLVCKYVENTYIKWPNDIYVNNKKIAGILIENKMSQQQIQASVIGVGINVNQTTFPTNIPNPTSLFIETKKTFSIELLIHQWQQLFIEHYSLLISQNFVNIDTEYHKHLFLKNQIASFLIKQQKTIKGTILRVNNAGELIVLVDNNEEKFRIGELEFV